MFTMMVPRTSCHSFFYLMFLLLGVDGYMSSRHHKCYCNPSTHNCDSYEEDSSIRRGLLASAGSGLFSIAAWGISLSPSPAWAVRDARGNQLAGLPDAPRGSVDQTPFNVVVENVRKALEGVGVEGQPSPPPKSIPGPMIDRDYAVGRRGGSDRLQPCPKTGGRACLSSSEDESSVAMAVAPFVYFVQKGDALGQLLSLIYDDADFTILRSDGNFFNGLGVYVLAERRENGYTFDMEFNFLPNVLESIVDVRIVERVKTAIEASSSTTIDQGSNSAGSTGGSSSSQAAARAALSFVAERLKWVPLDEAAKRSPEEWAKRIANEKLDPEAFEITQASEVGA